MISKTFSCISDLHIRKSGDKASSIFLNFLEHEVVRSSDLIILLGDIFEFLVGAHLEYYHSHKEIFEKLKLVLRTKRVIWVEGNHDFHFDKLLKKVFSKNELANFEYRIKPIICDDFYIGHGDELDIENTSYMKYRSWVRSSAVNLLAQNLVSYSFLHSCYKKFSKESRRSQSDYSRENEKSKFLNIAKNLKEAGFNKIVLGHSHISEETSFYVNNGYAASTKLFSHFNGEKLELVSL